MLGRRQSPLGDSSFYVFASRLAGSPILLALHFGCVAFQESDRVVEVMRIGTFQASICNYKKVADHFGITSEARNLISSFDGKRACESRR